MADSRSKSSPAKTILYLRPQRDEAIAALDLDDNKLYQDTVAPPAEPTDLPLDGFSENQLTSHLSSNDIGHNSVSRETTPGLYTICPRVFRLGFDLIDLINNPSARGFTFGSRPDSNAKLRYYVDKPRDKNRDYFRIHYNFNSGALLITAIDKIRIGSVLLGKNESLLLMAGTSIHCGGVFEFTVEFPDLSSCAKEHARNYQEYAAKLGIPDAQYLPTPRSEFPPIGAEHRSLAILGKGAFGEVHKALNIKDGKQVAIKILSEGGEREMNEVNIMSDLCHVSPLVDVLCRVLNSEKENIIKYERAFKLHSGQICIVMELAVNDLHTHQKARKNGKGRSYLSLQCIRSISRQALSALDYLHSKDVTHRDLKPTNILVTKWDANTDIPTIKLADFGLAAISSRHTTFCGTEGYIAPEVIQGHKRLEELQKAKDRGVKTVPLSQLLSYDKSIDIWTLGKILQDLIRDVPSSTRRKSAPVSKEPALHLIHRMMQEEPKKRPTAADCLEDPWVRTVNSGSLPAQKRNRSPTPTAEQPFKRVIQRTLKDPFSTDECVSIMNAILADESEYQNGLRAPSDIEMEDRQATQLTIQLGKRDRMSPASHCHYGTQMLESLIVIPSVILPDDAIPRGATPSMQDVARKLLEALQAEGYGSNVTVAGKSTDVGTVYDELSQMTISSIQIRQKSEDSIMLGLEFESACAEWTTGSWDKQCAVDNNIGPQSAYPDQHITASAGDSGKTSTFLELMFSQHLSSFAHPETARGLDQMFLPSITLNDDQASHAVNTCRTSRTGVPESLDRAITAQVISVPQSSVTSIGSSWSLSSQLNKGVTFPSNYDDIMADISY